MIHTSVDHLHLVPSVLRTWTGALSVSVFVPDLEMASASLFIERLVHCRPAVAERAAFHFLFPVAKPPRLPEAMEAVRRDVVLKAGCDLSDEAMLAVVNNETG